MKLTSKFRWDRRALPIAIAAAMVGMAAAAHATSVNEGTLTSGTYIYPSGTGEGQNGTCVDTLCTSYATPYDFSSSGLAPTKFGELTPGDNFIAGSLATYGSIYRPDGSMVGPHGELTNQDQDYITFKIPSGYVLDRFTVSDGTSIMTAPPRDDRLFLGLASGDKINIPYGPTANSAVGLLGYTLVSQAQVGFDILSAIGSADPANFPPAPGATGFTGSLGAGTYTLWLYDGDSRATYNFDLAVAAAPEPGAWALMTFGVGLIGLGMRRRRAKQATRVAYP